MVPVVINAPSLCCETLIFLSFCVEISRASLNSRFVIHRTDRRYAFELIDFFHHSIETTHSSVSATYIWCTIHERDIKTSSRRSVPLLSRLEFQVSHTCSSHCDCLTASLETFFKSWIAHTWITDATIVSTMTSTRWSFHHKNVSRLAKK